MSPFHSPNRSWHQHPWASFFFSKKNWLQDSGKRKLRCKTMSFFRFFILSFLGCSSKFIDILRFFIVFTVVSWSCPGFFVYILSVQLRRSPKIADVHFRSPTLSQFGFRCRRGQQQVSKTEAWWSPDPKHVQLNQHNCKNQGQFCIIQTYFC